MSTFVNQPLLYCNVTWKGYISSFVVDDPASEPNNSEKIPQRRLQRSCREHARVRHYSTPSSEGDSPSRDSSPLRDIRRDSSRHVRNEKRLASARRFGIDTPAQTVHIDKDEVEELYRSMDVHADSRKYRLHSIYVRGVDGLSAFQIKKIFAEFDPSAVEMIDEASCCVVWDDCLTVAKMMLEMTKPLKRIRGGRQVEEGEVADSSDEEEDGEMREEQGDDVTIKIVKGSSSLKSTDVTVIEVDVDQVEIPPGKWRVITKHVGHNRLIILRFGMRGDIAKRRAALIKERERSTSNSVDPDGYSYKWMNRRTRVRPGLNIFDEKGNELEWDYEHDTRFYEEGKNTPEEEKLGRSAMEDDSVAMEGSRKRKIRTRGRGAKRFKTLDDLLSGSGSLTADLEDLGRLKENTSSSSSMWTKQNSEENESDLSDDRDPSPTPQPWDPRKTDLHLRITKSNRKDD